MVMKMREDKCHPGRGKRVKIPLLPHNVGKKSVNEAVPQQGHDNRDGILHPLKAVASFFVCQISNNFIFNSQK